MRCLGGGPAQTTRKIRRPTPRKPGGRLCVLQETNLLKQSTERAHNKEGTSNRQVGWPSNHATYARYTNGPFHVPSGRPRQAT
jgi:hypothetical protein